MPGLPHAESLVSELPLEVLMLREGQTRALGQAAGYIWGGGEPFYGTMVGPWWYQTATRVARGCKLPFSVLRMLIPAAPNRRQKAVHPPQYTYGGRKAECRPAFAALRRG